jgi:hypothetical protein
LNRGAAGREDIRETVISQVTETVIQIFSWKEGTYEFQAQPVAVSKDMPISLDTQHLLMEGMRIVDEWSLIEGKITLDTVFRKAEATDVSLDEDEEAVLKYIDGESDAGSIIDLSGMGDFEASKSLVSMMEKGVIEAVEVIPVRKEAVAGPAPAKEWSFILSLPLILFVIAFVLSITIPVLSVNGTGMSIGTFLGGDSFKKLQTVRNVDGLRFRAEVYRYRNGAYPSDLGQIGGTRDAWGRPYEYRPEKDTLIIISAGPDGEFSTADDIY